MRTLVVLIALAVCVVNARAQKEPRPDNRFGVEAQPDEYPQKTPKETLASVLKSIEQNRYQYLLAHLVDPAFVDERVQAANGRFESVVAATAAKVRDDPSVLNDLQRFLENGVQEAGDSNDTASLRIKEVRNRAVYFKKINNRWFFENRQKTASKN